MGLHVAPQLAEDQQEAADGAVEELTQAILRQDWDYKCDPKEIRKNRREARQAQEEGLKDLADQIENELLGDERDSMNEMKLPGSDRSIMAVPLEDSGFAFDRQTFRDHVAMRMGQPCPDPLPEDCPRCGKKDIDRAHLLDCKTGGWVRLRHGEVQRAWAKVMRQACGTATLEPAIGPVSGPAFERKTTTTDEGARGDIKARGIFQDQVDSIFDTVVVNTFKPSAKKKGLKSHSILRAAEKGKRAEYEERVTRNGQTFTPLASSTLGTLDPEAEHVLLRLAKKLSKEHGEAGPAELHARMSIQAATIKATSLCLRSHESISTISSEHHKQGAEDEQEADGEKDFRVLQSDLGNPFWD
jgi:hypothetical protein